MEKIKIPTSFNIDLEFETPEFHKRLFAWVIDFAIIYAYSIIFRYVMAQFSAGHKLSDNNMPFLYNLSAVYLLLYVPILIYHLFFETVMNGQSIGKKIIGIKVIGENGGRPAIHQYLIRWLLRPVDFAFTLCLGGLLSVILSKKNQRLGDMAAGTLIIKTKIETDIDDTVFFELSDEYKPRFKEVMRLSDRDMNTIKGVLNNCKRYNTFDVAARMSEKIRSVLNILDYQEPVEFLETLLKDYNYFSNQN
ncbi:MAG TPA: RDD family protein [Parafilimonas sp.]|nr:RDD family protein [Parafilimonas sp.]